MWIDLLIIGLFAAYAIGSGFYNQRKASQNLTEYFLAGRSIPGWKGGCSMAATQFAADTPLLVTGLVATGGVFLLWRLWIYGIAFLLMAFVFSLCWRRSGVLTDAELTEVRYSGKGVEVLRVLKAVYYGTVINCVVMAMVLVATLRIAEVFLPWHDWLPEGIFGPVRAMVDGMGLKFSESMTGLDAPTLAADQLITIIVLFSFTALYSVTGGLRSVIATDVVQLFIALGGTAIYAWVLLSEIGGIGALNDRIVALYGKVQAVEFYSFIPPPDELAAGFFIIIGLQWLFQMNSDGTGYLAQRSMACRSEKEAVQAGVLFSWLQIGLRSLIWLFIALALLAVYPFTADMASGDGFTAAREMTFVEGIRDHMPAGARGLMLVALLAALASTLDTHLNWGASYWANDIYGSLWCRRIRKSHPSAKTQVLVARLSNLLLIIISLIVVANLGSIQQAWKVSLLFGAGMGSVLVMRWLWERINLYSELAAMAVSLVIAPFLLQQSDWADWQTLGTMALVSTTAAVLAALFGPRTSDAKLEAFFQKVRPVGFWSETAQRLGQNPGEPKRQLRMKLLAVAAGSIALFATLAGLSKTVLPGPDESRWIGVLLLVVAVVMTPFWWGPMQRSEPTPSE